MTPEDLATLRSSHPDWSIWQSNAGSCYASRYLVAEEARSGKVATLAADTLDQLADKLRTAAA